MKWVERIGTALFAVGAVVTLALTGLGDKLGLFEVSGALAVVQAVGLVAGLLGLVCLLLLQPADDFKDYDKPDPDRVELPWYRSPWVKWALVALPALALPAALDLEGAERLAATAGTFLVLGVAYIEVNKRLPD